MIIEYKYFPYVLLFLCLPVNVSSQWSTDPNENLQISSWGQSAKACTDGNGGVYILWNINSYYTSQYLQWVDKYGYVRWSNPVEIKGEYNGTYFGYSSLSEDGHGGALVSFTEWEVDWDIFPGDWIRRIRVTRTDSLGNFMWDSLGVRVSLIDTSQNLSQVVPDGDGGAFVSFGVIYDYGDQELWVQHVSSTGERLWGEDGILVTDSINANITHNLISDGEGGIIVDWYGDDTGFKRYDLYGNLIWYVPSPDPTYLFYSKIIANGDGGVIGTGTHHIPNNKKLVINQINSNGEVLWGEYGVTIADSIDVYSKVSQIVLRPDSITIVFWTNVIDIYGDHEALLEMISPDGELFFENGGIPPSIVPVSIRIAKSVQLSDNNSAVLLFGDNRAEPQSGAYAQKLSSTGEILWDSSDVAFSYLSGTTRSVLSDGSSGLISVASDEPLYGIFAQQISRNGILGEVLEDSIGVDKLQLQPNDIILEQNYPNPFNSNTRFGYSIQQASQVTISIYNILGEVVLKHQRDHNHATTDIIVWDGKDASGRLLSSGVYLYEIKEGKNRILRKMVLLR